MNNEIKIMNYAIDAHENVNHKYNGSNYAIHLIMVVHFAKKYIDLIPDQCQDEVICACWLHDTIEDCRLTYNDIFKVAGESVANIVYAVSNEKGKNRKERANEIYYKCIRETAWATFVKLCDRLANVQYSKENKSSMLSIYQKENEHFLESLKTVRLYQPMIDELTILLK